jgi:hypothetical protein
MPEEYRQVAPEPDEFDRQLRNLTTGKAEPARFTELSAAERAKRAAARSKPAAKPKRMSWRNTWRARKRRRPADGPQSGGPNRSAGRPPGGARRPRPARSTRQQRLRSIAKTVGVLLAFCALLFVLHLLGLGPQGG